MGASSDRKIGGEVKFIFRLWLHFQVYRFLRLIFFKSLISKHIQRFDVPECTDFVPIPLASRQHGVFRLYPEPISSGMIIVQFRLTGNLSTVKIVVGKTRHGKVNRKNERFLEQLIYRFCALLLSSLY